MSTKKFDVIIVGAGPAGASTAIALGNSGLSVGLFDKASFPRDKTCGDALSVDVVNQLKILSPALWASFEQSTNKIESYGVTLFSPDGHQVDIPFIYQNEKRCGYIFPRLSFDNVLVQHLLQYPNVQFFQSRQMTHIQFTDSTVEMRAGDEVFTAPIVVGADGAHSIVAKHLQDSKPDKAHYSAGLRMYYEGIKGFNVENFIELHFFKKILPGYLWIFPLADNKANVGIGMLSSVVSKKKINLKETLTELIASDARFKERFRDAKPLETIKGFGLPLGSKKRKISGERFILTGDAASLIDPFTGEGIANAIRSGRIAADHIRRCHDKNNFSENFNTAYDNEIYRRMWKELKLSRGLQQLCRYPWLFNYVAGKANNNKHVHQLLVDSMANIDKKKSLITPSFYYRLLLNK